MTTNHLIFLTGFTNRGNAKLHGIRKAPADLAAQVRRHMPQTAAPESKVRLSRSRTPRCGRGPQRGLHGRVVRLLIPTCTVQNPCAHFLHIDSDFSRFGNPQNESDFAQAGIRLAEAAVRQNHGRRDHLAECAATGGVIIVWRDASNRERRSQPALPR